MKREKNILIILLIIFIIFLITYNTKEEGNKNYQNNTYILNNYTQYNNTELIFDAKIKIINTSNQTIMANIRDKPYTLMEIKTMDIEKTLHEGDKIFVIGILNGKNHIIAKTIIVREPWHDVIIVLSSIPAIPFVIYLFLRTWKFNRKTMNFERRQKNA
jgi:hypothetical protein